MRNRLLQTKPVAVLAILYIILLALSASITANAQDSYVLQYKFKKGEKLQYKSERQDSTESDSGGQTTVREMTIWSLQTLSIEDAKKDRSFTISIKTDSVWTDQDQSMGQVPGMGRGMGGGRGRTFRMGGRGRDRSYEITPEGKSLSKDPPPIIPFLFPMPEKAIAVNETWDFTIASEQKGQRQGTTTITGQCLLYDVQKVGDQTLALIIVNADTKIESKFEFQREGGDPISGSSASSVSAQNLVYFDIGKGRIVEVVGEEIRESITESTMFSSDSYTKSKTNVILVLE